MPIVTGQDILAADVLTALEDQHTQIVSDNLRHSNDAQKDTVLLAYVKLKEILLDRPLDNCRIKFDLNRNASFDAYGRIYKNGVAIGTERHTGAADGWFTYSEDLAGWLTGDLIQIYGYTTGGTCSTRNMRFYYDNIPVPQAPTNQDP